MSFHDLLAKFEELKPKDKEEFISCVKDWALLHGLGMRPKNPFSDNMLVNAPFTLFPSPVEQSNFEKALKIQPIMNSLFHRLAYDPEFLESALSETIAYDGFTRRLFEIYTIVKKEGFTQGISLGLFRSDYLKDIDNKLKLVEMNTVASSMAGLISRVEVLHRFVLRKLGLDDHMKYLPENSALTNLSYGLVKAWKYYNVPNSVIMFLVEDVTVNIADQRHLEYEINNTAERPKVIRRTFSDIINFGRVGSNSELIVGNSEVAVVYFRTGYDPSQFTGEEHWNARLMMERSKAIKCPSIQYHLVGSKKVQQVISNINVLEKYVPDKESLALLKETFVDIFPLDKTKEGKEGYRIAQNKPENFVLKPQREGGGHNIYGNDIPKYLLSLSREEAYAYILMRLIQPDTNPNVIVRPDDVISADVVSELGVYGVIIGDENDIFVNETSGHMLRTKGSTEREVGVVAGFGVLDSPYLV